MLVIKSARIISLVALVVLLGTACEEPMLVEPSAASYARVTANFSLLKTAMTGSGIDSLAVQVTGAGMDTMTMAIPVTAEGQIRLEMKVPSGSNRVFSVAAYREDTAVMAGRDSLDLKAGKDAVLNMKLGFLVPALSLTPIDTTVAVNSTFTLYVRAHHVDSLCTIGARLKFDPARLQAVDLGREDDFLKKNGGAVTQLQFSKDNTAGEVNLLLGIFPATKSVSGEGAIARIVFKAVTGPAAEVGLSIKQTDGSDLGLYDQHANLMPAIALGSRIIIQ